MTTELKDLCSAAVEGRLTAAEAARLEELVFAHPEMLKYYANYSALHAALVWSAADPKLLEGDLSPSIIEVQQSIRRRVYWPGWAVAAMLVMALVGWATTGRSKTIATLTEANACKWQSGSLPTEPGARLTAGRLRLAEGVARVIFESGADIRVEGPADFELIDQNRCSLFSGRLVASVPPSAKGFVVDTPSASLTDLGTEFGVIVRDQNVSDVQVFNGIVDGKPRDASRIERMTTGQGRRFRADSVSLFDPLKDEVPPIGPELPRGHRSLSLSTAMGHSKDAYIFKVNDPKHRSDILMLVKNQDVAPNRLQYDRKAYFAIDLSAITGQRVVDAHLSLTLDKTDMGFASEVPDATFAVYGLTDESLDGWSETGINWDNAPANRPGGSELDETMVTKLGTFEVGQGIYTGTRTVGGSLLIEFLNRDTNKLATFILVRETKGSIRQSLVHGFANKRHPTLPPPTLKVTVAPK